MEPFIGQVIMFAGNFAPRGWAFCEGQLLAINSNQALFSILGTTYGGDGRTTFALPDLRGRVAIHPGNGPGLPSYQLGQKGGADTTTINVTNMPSHNHQATVSVTSALHFTPAAGDETSPGGGSLAIAPATAQIYSADPPPNTSSLAPASITNSATANILNNGGQQPFNNMQPYLAVNYIIALIGLFPSRN